MSRLRYPAGCKINNRLTRQTMSALQFGCFKHLEKSAIKLISRNFTTYFQSYSFSTGFIGFSDSAISAARSASCCSFAKRKKTCSKDGCEMVYSVTPKPRGLVCSRLLEWVEKHRNLLKRKRKLRIQKCLGRRIVSF